MGSGEVIALISTGGTILVALIGVLIELVRTRRRQDKVVHAVEPNTGGSMRDAVDRIEEKLAEHGERMAALETRVSDHLMITAGSRRRGRW